MMELVITDINSDYNGKTARQAVRDLEDRIKTLEAIVDRLEGVDL